MTSKVKQIVELYDKGLSISEVAGQLGIIYQHAYNELRRYGRIAVGDNRGRATSSKSSRERWLAVDVLKEADFRRHCRFVLAENGDIAFDALLPTRRGVYAICVDERAQYVGVASMGIAHRLKFYLKPGSTQRTSIRINGLVRSLLEHGRKVEVFVAFPDDYVWNGLPVDGCAGLESALIGAYDLPWNIRGARKSKLA